MVGNARGKRKVDPPQCFQLLQKLVVALERAQRPEVREYQRRCEDALIDVLLKGAPPPVGGWSQRGRGSVAVAWCDVAVGGARRQGPLSLALGCGHRPLMQSLECK